MLTSEADLLLLAFQRALTPELSRSCTPSQQTTSFGMGDDDEISEEIIREDDLLTFSSEQLGEGKIYSEKSKLKIQTFVLVNTFIRDLTINCKI